MQFCSGITFIYFDDYPGSCKRLEEFGFTQRVDYGYAKLFESAPGCFIGAVNAKDVNKCTQKEKGATLCFTTESVQRLHAWNKELKQKGAEVTDVARSDRLEYYAFTSEGPEGYRFEFGTFINPQEAAMLNPAAD